MASLLHGGGVSSRGFAGGAAPTPAPPTPGAVARPGVRRRAATRQWQPAEHHVYSAKPRRRGAVAAALATYTASFEEEMGWRTDFGRQYVHGRLLGQGSFGSVYLGVDLHTGSEVAVKVLPKVRGKLSREKTLDKLAREVDVLERLQGCPGVIHLVDVFEDTDTVSIVTELCSGGDLQHFAEARGSLDERALAHVALEVLRIVKACHDAGLLHGDVKPANFCLKHPTHNPLASPHLDFSSPAASSWLKAIDFGCSQMLPVYRRLSKRTGTPVYMAPETYQRDYHKEADMWSVGVMLYQLYARRFPFWDTVESCKASQLDEVAHAVATADIPFNYGPWLSMSAEGRAFVSGCLQRNPALRLTVQEALQHPWLQRMVSASTQSQQQLLLQQQQYYYAAQQAAAAAAAAAGYQQQGVTQHNYYPAQQAQQQQQQQPQYQQAQARVRPQPLAAAGPTPYHQQQQQAVAKQQAVPQQHQQHSSAGRVGALANANTVPSAAQAA